MKRLALMLILAVVFSPLVVHSASLGKYSDPPVPASPERYVQPGQVKQRLNQKMEEAIERLNAMPSEERKKWIHYYVLKMQAAQKKGNYLESGYYSGILAGVGVE